MCILSGPKLICRIAYMQGSALLIVCGKLAERGKISSFTIEFSNDRVDSTSACHDAQRPQVYIVESSCAWLPGCCGAGRVGNNARPEAKTHV
jgi:hypothetical protein